MYKVNQFIEHTLLKPDSTEREILKLIDEAHDHNFLGICVPPFWVKKVARELEKSSIQLVTVIGFPLGYNLTQIKIKEIKTAIDHGANELDIVMNISAFKSGHPWAKIDLARCAKVIHENDCLMKVIIETALLSNEEIEKACHICLEAGSDFVKSSTGFADEGAVPDKIKLIRKSLPQHVGVKASGGIKSYLSVINLIESGADRIGTSAGVQIIKESIEYLKK